MFKVQRSALVPYSAKQMFVLVNDIEVYPQFMDGCVAAEILRRGDDWCEARLTLGYKGIQQSFVTRNELQPPVRMNMALVEGPFSQFEGSWCFDALGDNACKVSLDLRFDFKNALLKMTVGRQLEKIAGHQLDELCRQARNIYDKPED